MLTLEERHRIHEENEAKHEKIHLTPQAKLYALGYILLLLTMIIAMMNKKLTSVSFITYLLFNIVVFILSVYVINCTVVGRCFIYAWIMAYIMIIFSIVVAINVLVALFKKN
jgi:hypothetical protein